MTAAQWPDSANSNQPVLQAVGLTKVYDRGPTEVVAVNDVDLSVAAGQVVVIKGRSGSGKTTLLNMLGGLDDPTGGSVHLDGRSVSDLSHSHRSAMHRHDIAFIFQSFGLIPILTARENVEVPLRLARVSAAERSDRALELLDLVGLADRAKHRPGELSGGEQQRVAIARSMANRPRLLLADEPTGQLDSKTGRSIVDLLSGLVRADGIAAVIATHDAAVLRVADQVIELNDGVASAPEVGS